MPKTPSAPKPSLTKRAVDAHNKRDLLEFYLAASQLLTGWVDYQPGDLPSDLLKRASQLLHLYGDAAKDSYAAIGTSD